MNNSKKSLPSIKTKLTNFKGALLKPKIGLIYLMMIILLASILAFWGFTNHLFWDDEANTAVFARNFLELGELKA